MRTRLVVPPRALLGRRIVALVALTWLPLVVLCLVAGTALGGVDLPLSRDLVVHVRFLLAVPLLILGELLLQRSLGGVLLYLGMSGVVPPSEEDSREVPASGWQRAEEKSAPSTGETPTRKRSIRIPEID